MSSREHLLAILQEIEFPLEWAHSGEAIFIVTAGCCLDLNALKKVRGKNPDSVVVRQNRRIDDILKQHRRVLGQSSFPLDHASRLALMQELRVAAPYARISGNLEDVAQAMDCCYTSGDIAHEPMLGQHGILWLLGNRM